MAKKVLFSCVGLALLAVGVGIGKFSGPASKDGDSQPGRTPSGGYTTLSPRSGTGPATGPNKRREAGEAGKDGSTPRAADPSKILNVFNVPNGSMATTALYAELRKMSGDEIAEMLVGVDELANHARRREVRERLVDYLTMTDPVKALELRDVIDGQGILDKSFKQLGRNGLGAAAMLIDELEDAGDRRKALLSAFVGASEVDPVGAFAALKTMEGVTSSHYHEVFDNWAETDPVAAASAALTVESPSERRSALKIVGQEWAERDPEAVLAWLDSTSLSSYETETIRKAAVKGFAKRDPLGALEMLSTLDPGTRSRLLPDTVQQLARTDPQAAVEWLKSEPDGYAKNKALEDAISYIARQAPLEAIELAKDYPKVKDNALSNAFSTLARDDLPKTLELLKEWEGDKQYSNILRNVASRYAKDLPKEALAWALDLPHAQKSLGLSSVLRNLAGDDPHLAIQHLDLLSGPGNEPHLSTAISNIASSWAMRDSAAATEWLHSLPESPGKDGGIRSVADRLANDDPVSAAEFLETFPDSNGTSNGIREVADKWARVDPVSASEWIGKMPEGPTRDAAASSLIRHIQNDDPGRAIAWAQSLSDESNRSSQEYNVYRNWMRYDEPAALESLASSSMPDNMKRRLVPELQQQFNEEQQLRRQQQIELERARAAQLKSRAGSGAGGIAIDR